MGRIIGAPNLTLSAGKNVECGGKRNVLRITRTITPEERSEIRSAQQKQLLGQDVPLPASRKKLADAKAAWVKTIQESFDGHLIRRDKNSKRPDGSRINDLQPYDMHMIPVTLKDWEMEVLSNSMGDVISKKHHGALRDITSEVGNMCCYPHTAFV
jgi:hypothetical protein